MADDSVTVDLLANNKQMSDALKDSESAFTAFGNKVKGIMAAVAAAFAIKQIFDFAAGAVMAFGEAEVAETRLGAVLRATGEAAGHTKEDLVDLSNEMQRLTRFEAETTQGAMSVLATFKNVKGDIFKDATWAAADMAEVLGTDLQGATMQLGKALNDPTQGLNALRRAGVSFTDQQKSQIKALQESGDMMGAQRIILDELAAEFGGTAKEIGGTFLGRLEQLKNRLGDIVEDIGAAMMPMIEAVEPVINSVAGRLSDMVPMLADAVQWMVDRVTAGIDIVRPYIEAAFNALTSAAKSTGPYLAAAGDSAVSVFESIIDALGPVVGLAKSAFGVVSSVVSSVLPTLYDLWGTLMKVVDAVANALAPIIEVVSRRLSEWYDIISGSVVPAVGDLQSWIANLVDGIVTLLAPALEWLGELFATVVDAVSGWFIEAIKTAASTVSEFAATIYDALEPVFAWLVDAGIMAFTAVQTVIQNWSDVSLKAVLEFGLAFVTTWETVKHWLTTVAPDLLSWLGRNWKQVFMDVANATATILSNMFTNITEFFKAVWSWLKGEGFDWSWKGLMDGFESTLEEMPVIAERQKSALETAMGVSLDVIDRRLTDAFDERLEKNRKTFADAFKREAKPTGGDAAAAAGAAGAEAAEDQRKATPSAYTGDDKDDDDKDFKATFEDLSSLNKRISAAAAGGSKDDKVKSAVEKGAKDQVEAQKEVKTAVDGVQAAVTAIAPAVSTAITNTMGVLP